MSALCLAMALQRALSERAALAHAEHPPFMLSFVRFCAARPMLV